MGVENQLERAERLVREIEEAERDVSRAEARLAAARQRAASVRSRQSSTDRRASEKARNEAREADAAVGAAEAALEQARRKLGTSRAAREELGRGMVRYVSDQNRAVAQVRKAMAAAPYGREDLSRLRQQATGHARTGNRVLQILGMETIALDEGEDPRAPFPSAGAVASRAPGGLDESQSFATVAAAPAVLPGAASGAVKGLIGIRGTALRPVVLLVVIVVRLQAHGCVPLSEVSTGIIALFPGK